MDGVGTVSIVAIKDQLRYDGLRRGRSDKHHNISTGEYIPCKVRVHIDRIQG